MKAIFILFMAILLQSCSLKAPAYIKPTSDVSEMLNPNLKSATACAYAPFWFAPVVGFHDNINILKASKEAGIKNIDYIHSNFTTYILFTKYCETAYGK